MRYGDIKLIYHKIVIKWISFLLLNYYLNVQLVLYHKLLLNNYAIFVIKLLFMYV